MDESMHIAVIDVTCSGKSTALRALMADSVRRVDRQVVAYPESAALQTYFATGDVILNPFDARCARWDLLAEIERPSDFAFLSSRSEEHTSELQSLMRISYAVFCLKKKKSGHQKP